MAELKQILSDIAKSIVDQPDEVIVTEEVDGNSVTLTLNVAPDDMGKVIGKHGRIAKSIRLLMRAAATSTGRKVSVEIR